MAERGNEFLGEEDPSIAHGAALGAGGVEGWWAWRNRRRTQRGVDAVSPGTARGALHVALWFAGLASIIVLGTLLTSLSPIVWTAIGLVVMYGVGRWWGAKAISGGRTSGARRRRT